MTDVRAKYVPPAIDQLAFNCPHCGAYAKQFWFSVQASNLEKDSAPTRLTPETADSFIKQVEKDSKDAEHRRRTRQWAKQMGEGEPFIEPNSRYCSFDAYNISFSRCFNCNKIAVWLYDRLAWPIHGEGPVPNSDMPTDVRRDFEEASSILRLSPRGATALLRLCVQKLCKQLGQSGKDINDDIKSLVQNGLDVRVQQALDVVRVVGNNAVHPGQLDLRDDVATAEKLFGLVNLITEIMISQPKHIASMFDSLPENAKRAIEKRDAKKPDA